MTSIRNASAGGITTSSRRSAPDGERAARPRRSAFTLIETLAAILLTSMIIAFALGAYVQVADTAESATLVLQDELHATTILSRMAEDLQSTVLVVKPDEEDPLRHPWYFVAESQQAFAGSDAIRFIGRRARSYQADAHDSDFAQIAYQVTTDDDGLQTLHRWLLPGLPERYEPTFPPVDDDRSFVLGEGLSGFSMRFLSGLDEEGVGGEWVETW
jgi:type II secretory pathway component PulJ